MLVVGTPNRIPGPILSICMQEHNVPGKEHMYLLVMLVVGALETVKPRAPYSASVCNNTKFQGRNIYIQWFKKKLLLCPCRVGTQL
jgi:hypothetical protein